MKQAYMRVQKERWYAEECIQIALCVHINALVPGRVKCQIQSDHRTLSPKTVTYGVFDCEFGFDSHEWSCSNDAY